MINDSIHVWHVAKTGNDANSGHAQQYPINLAVDAKLTIGAAITAAASDDTIIINVGDYNEGLQNGIGYPLHIMGTNFNGCVFRQNTVGDANPVYFPAPGKVDAGMTFENLQFLGKWHDESVYPPEANKTGGVGMDPDNNFTSINCIFWGSQDAVHCASHDNLKFRKCEFHGQWDALQLASSNNVVVEDCNVVSTGHYNLTVSNRAITSTSGGDFIVRGTVAKIEISSTNTPVQQSSPVDISYSAALNIESSGLVENCYISGNGLNRWKPNNGWNDSYNCALHFNAGGIGFVQNCLIVLGNGPGLNYAVALKGNSSGYLYDCVIQNNATQTTFFSKAGPFNAVVTSVVDTQTFKDSQIAGIFGSDDSFVGYEIEWITGNNIGQKSVVAYSTNVDGTISAVAAFSSAITIGDEYLIRSREVYDIYVEAGSTLYLSNTKYDANKVGGAGTIIDLTPSVDSSGRVDLVDVPNDTALAAMVAKLMADTGITAGGVWTYEKAIKTLLAVQLGTVMDKSGSPGVQEILDPDDGTTVIAELTLSTTTPQRSLTVL